MGANAGVEPPDAPRFRCIAGGFFRGFTLRGSCPECPGSAQAASLGAQTIFTTGVFQSSHDVVGKFTGLKNFNLAVSQGAIVRQRLW